MVQVRKHGYNLDPRKVRVYFGTLGRGNIDAGFTKEIKFLDKGWKIEMQEICLL